MNLFVRNKIFLYAFYFTILVGFISICTKIANQFVEPPILINQIISKITNSKTNASILVQMENKCINRYSPSRRALRKLILDDDLLNYLGFVVQSHSLFYCSIPKVATRTLLLFITYLHIRDDLIPLLMNNSQSDILNTPYLNQTVLSKIKNGVQTSKPIDSLSLLELFLTEFILTNSSKFDLWSFYQNKLFPLIRLRSLSDPTIIFSPNYLRIIFVRHPFERLASAYIDKISSLNNQPFSLYDRIRRLICQKYSSIYLTIDQRNAYRKNKKLIKQINEPCQNIIPKFEHFIEYLISDPIEGDVHWRPYSNLCHVCLLKYNFIGKFEVIEDDLRRLLIYLGLNTNDWIKENYFNSGKTKENYRLMFSQLNHKLICFLKYFYRYDLDLFNYRIEDYFISNKTIQCSSIQWKKLPKTKFL